MSEFSAIIDVIDGKADKSAILSPYEDAVETYKLVSVLIRSAFPGPGHAEEV